jgi:hypothetical protein
MTLAPNVASTGYLKCDGTTVGGVTDCKIGDKDVTQDITSLGDTAKARYPTIQDPTLTFTVVYDKDDAGQDKVIAAKAAKTLYEYKRYLTSTTYYTVSGYVESLDWTALPDGIVMIDVVIATTTTAVLTVP